MSKVPLRSFQPYGGPSIVPLDSNTCAVLCLLTFHTPLKIAQTRIHAAEYVQLLPESTTHSYAGSLLL